MSNARSLTGASLIALAAALGAAIFSGGAALAADVLLSGTITSAAGEKMGGVTVSAKAAGATHDQRLHDEAGIIISRRCRPAATGSGRRPSPMRPARAASRAHRP
jgi:hypothetical protein